MLKLAFENIENVEVSDLEMKLSKPSFTLQTVRYLQKENPDQQFYLCLGEDSLRDFHKWHKYDELLERLCLIVAKRPGIDTSEVVPEILERTIFISHEPVSASSTTIRELNGKKKSDLPLPVAEYIKKHNLYQ